MKLYDPQRPKVYHKPAFLPGHHPIQRLQIWPLEDGTLEVALMLPLGDNRFSGMFFNTYCSLDEIQGVISQFTDDPEHFVEKYFSKNPAGFIPGVGSNAPKVRPTASPQPTSQTLNLLDE